MIENSKCINCGHHENQHAYGQYCIKCVCGQFELVAQLPKDEQCKHGRIEKECWCYESQPPDPKLSIVEEFKREFVEYHDDYKPHLIEYKGDRRGQEINDVIEWLLAALEAHGKAEKEKGYQLGKEWEEEGFNKGHAAGFTEGVEKALEEIHKIIDVMATGEIAAKEELFNTISDSLHALKAQTIKP